MTGHYPRRGELQKLIIRQKTKIKFLLIKNIKRDVSFMIKKMSLELSKLIVFLGTKTQIKGLLMFLHCKEDMNKVPSTLFQCLCLCNASNGRSVLPLGHEGFKSINNFSEKD